MASGAYIEPPLQTAVVAGRRQAWREAGEGERLPLFLMHGIGSNACAWAGQFAGFADERRVVAWNAPGYIGSERLRGEWPSAADYASAALELMNHVHMQRCVLVGQSLGAIMATSIARTAPDRVSLLVLVSPATGYASKSGEALPVPVASRIDELGAWGAMQFATRRAPALLTSSASDAAREIIRLAMSELEPEGYLQAARMLACADLASELESVESPSAVVWGDEDRITPPVSCRRIATAARMRGIELDKVGHALATEAPARFNETLRSLIASTEKGMGS